MQKIHAMKKVLLIIIVVAIVVIAAKLTVPTEEKHYQVARQKLSTIVNQKLTSIDGAKDLIQNQGGEVRELIQVALNQMEVKDYFVCNVGRITYNGSTYPLTVGVFGKVFMLTDYKDEFQNAGKKVEEYKKKFN